MSKPTVTEYILATAIVRQWLQDKQSTFHCTHCNEQQPATSHHGEKHDPACPVILARMIIEQAHPQE